MTDTRNDKALSEHKHIYLSPQCKDDCERTWCQDDNGPCDQCDAQWTKYVLASDAAADLDKANAEAGGMLLLIEDIQETLQNGFPPTGERAHLYISVAAFLSDPSVAGTDLSAEVARLRRAVSLVRPLMERYEGQGEGGTAEFNIAMQALHAAWVE